MELFKVCVEDVSVNQNRTFHAVDRTGFACELQENLMGHAVDDLCVLVTEKLTAQLLGGFSYLVLLGQVVVGSGFIVNHGDTSFRRINQTDVAQQKENTFQMTFEKCSHAVL